MNAGRRTHVTVVADEKVKVLPSARERERERAEEVTRSPKIGGQNQADNNEDWSYLTNGAAVRKAGLGQTSHFSRRVVADDVEVMLEGSVFGALEIHQLGQLIHPDLIKGTRRAKRLGLTTRKATRSSPILLCGEKSVARGHQLSLRVSSSYL